MAALERITDPAGFVLKQLWHAAKTCSKTVNSGSMLVVWNVLAKPCETRSLMDKLLRFCPLNLTTPADTGTVPEIKLTDVDLPDPFGPISPTISECLIEKLRPLTA